MPEAVQLLLVEDDAAVRAEVVAYLSEAGFEVKEAENGQQGLALLAHGFRPRAILLDLAMPVMNGVAMHDILQQHSEWSTIPIILLTGASRSELPVEVEAVIAKPFQLERLLRVVQQVAPTEAGLCRILLVEDEPSIREGIEELLTASGYAVVTASDGQSALEQLTLGWIPDVILTDLMMPRMSGVELIQTLRQHPQWVDIPVIVASAATGTLKETPLQVDGVVPKPIDYQRLVGFLNRAYARSRKRSKRRPPLPAPNATGTLAAEAGAPAPGAPVPDGRARFFATVAHELRNPLQVLASSVHRLQRTTLDPAQQRLAQSAVSSAQRMARLVEDVLDFVQAEGGSGFRIRREQCDLARVCAQTLEELRTASPGRTLELSAPPELRGFCDPHRLAQVVVNLVQNAIKYGDPEQPIRVSLLAEDGAAVLQVRNAGKPIPESEIATLFDPFKRAVKAEDRRPGLGLGLAIVKQIAFAHDGAVDVQSHDAETVFSVVLPLGPAAGRQT